MDTYIDHCPKSFANWRISSLCEDGPVSMVKSRGTVYRNHYCEICQLQDIVEAQYPKTHLVRSFVSSDITKYGTDTETKVRVKYSSMQCCSTCNSQAEFCTDIIANNSFLVEDINPEPEHCQLVPFNITCDSKKTSNLSGVSSNVQSIQTLCSCKLSFTTTKLNYSVASVKSGDGNEISKIFSPSQSEVRTNISMKEIVDITETFIMITNKSYVLCADRAIREMNSSAGDTSYERILLSNTGMEDGLSTDVESFYYSSKSYFSNWFTSLACLSIVIYHFHNITVLKKGLLYFSTKLLTRINS